MMELMGSIADAARGCGVSAAFADAAPFELWAADPGHVRAGNVSAEPMDILSGARSIIVLCAPWCSYGCGKGTAAISGYYLDDGALERAGARVSALLEAHSYKGIFTDRIPLKCAAVRSGAGVRSGMSLFMHESLGTKVKLAAVVSDAPLRGRLEPENTCSLCGACASACPVGALEQGRFNYELCLRRYTLQGLVPRTLRRAMGNRLLGCEECQRACAANAFEDGPLPGDIARLLRIDNLLVCDRDTVRRLGALIGRNYARVGRIRAQAALCAGNSADGRYLPLLRAMAEDSYDAVRAHTAWAAAMLGDLALVRSMLRAETNENVAADIAQTICELGG